MHMYFSMLEAMERLLDRAGETHWRDWIRTDIQRWHKFRDSTHHRQAYGGMGSINDTVLSFSHGSEINAEAAKRASQLYDWLRLINYRNSIDPEHKRFNFTTLAELKKLIGYDNANFECHAYDFANVMTICNANQEVQGRRCQNCGYSEIENKEINNYLNASVFPAMFINACQQDQLLPFVDDVLENKLPAIEALVPQFKKIMKKEDIHCVDTINDNNKICPICSAQSLQSCSWKMKEQKLVAVQ